LKVQHEHWPISDPSEPHANEAKQLARFRQVRDLLIEKINGLKARIDKLL